MSRESPGPGVVYSKGTQIEIVVNGLNVYVCCLICCFCCFECSSVHRKLYGAVFRVGLACALASRPLPHSAKPPLIQPFIKYIFSEPRALYSLPSLSRFQESFIRTITIQSTLFQRHLHCNKENTNNYYRSYLQIIFKYTIFFDASCLAHGRHSFVFMEWMS